MTRNRRSLGTIYEIEGGWNVQVSYYLKDEHGKYVLDEKGKKIQKRLGERVHSTNYRDAERVKLELLRRVDNMGKARGITINANTTFGTFLETKYIPFLHRRTSKGCSPSTAMTIESRFRLHVLPYEIASVPCCKLDCLKMDDWMGDLRAARPDLSEQMLNNVLGNVRAACRQGVAYDLIPKDPTAGMADKPHPRRYQAHSITKDEANILMTAFLNGHPFGLALALVLTVGLRPGEVCALRWKDWDLDAATVTPAGTVGPAEGGGVAVHRTKTEGSARKVHVPRKLMPLVLEHRRARMSQNLAWGNPEALLYSQRNGAPVWPRELSKSFQKLRQSLGLPEMRLYDERHATARLALAAGVNIHTVSRMIMRHQRMSTTSQFYLGDDEDMARNAAEVLGDIMLPPRKSEG